MAVWSLELTSLRSAINSGVIGCGGFEVFGNTSSRFVGARALDVHASESLGFHGLPESEFRMDPCSNCWKLDYHVPGLS